MTGDDHESAEDWYDSYGWHLITAESGDICLQAVDYDWLDDPTDEAVAELLVASHSRIRADEAMQIVQMARRVRAAAESICHELDVAVAAYWRGDLSAVRTALFAARDQEDDHGDSPATDDLARRLLGPLAPPNMG